MLKWIHLENLALLEYADLEFDGSFNVISGETGAGKSVLMGGVALLLGGRSDRSMIRIGADRCTVSGEFTVPEGIRDSVLRVLEEYSIREEENGSLLIRRVLTASSSRNFINETPVTLQVLRRIGELMVDIHSAHENHYLMKTDHQLSMLDRFGKCGPLLAECDSLWKELASLRKEQLAFSARMPSAEENARNKQEELLIANASVTPGEDSLLEEKHALAAHSRNLIELSRHSSAALAEEEQCILDHLGLIRRVLSDMEHFDPSAGERFLAPLDEIRERIIALADDLSGYASEIEIDEGSFHQMEERLHTLHSLKRRYGPTLEDVLAYLETIRNSIDLYENAAKHREDFARREKELLATLSERCVQLHLLREKASVLLTAKVEKELKKLGFPKGRFLVELSGCELGPSGSDKVEFMFSANPGVPPMELRSVASSGELSRVMLALKTILAEEDLIPILIFDEIDANIGGETASKVADAILSLAREKQILCISHLPQIACRAQRQFCVTKVLGEENAVTRITQLDLPGRVREISRMLGGGRDAAVLASKMLGVNG